MLYLKKYMYKEIIEKIKPDLEKVLDLFDEKIARFHVGKASPALIENIKVDCFGEIFPLKHLCAISVPSPRELVIQPWDKSYIEGIQKTLERENIGTVRVESELIRVILPPLSEEYRKEFLKKIKQEREKIRKTIRLLREKAWKEIQEGFQRGEIREDDKYRGKDELQKLIDEYNEKVEEIIRKKEKEIMES